MSESGLVRPPAANLRAFALNSKTSAKPIALELEGQTFFVHAPTVGIAAEIQSKAVKVEPGKVKGSTNLKLDVAAQKALAILRLVKDDYGKPVFEETDIDAILSAPAGGLIDQLGEAALKQLNVDPEDIRGN